MIFVVKTLVYGKIIILYDYCGLRRLIYGGKNGKDRPFR